MALHIEHHDDEYLLVTDTGKVLATFVDSAAADQYKKEVSLTWIFAHEVGRTGI